MLALGDDVLLGMFVTLHKASRSSGSGAFGGDR